jgi:hypothetical protein
MPDTKLIEALQPDFAELALRAQYFNFSSWTFDCCFSYLGKALRSDVASHAIELAAINNSKR